MHRKIIKASIFLPQKPPLRDLGFAPGINILRGEQAQTAVRILAGIFGDYCPGTVEAELCWQPGIRVFVSGGERTVFVDRVELQGEDPAQKEKAFHKTRFLCRVMGPYVLDGAEPSVGFFGEGEGLLRKLRSLLEKPDRRPLFVYNFLERLDEAVDLQPIFEALNATGRQVFIAVPHYYNMKQLEEMPYDIHAL